MSLKTMFRITGIIFNEPGKHNQSKKVIGWWLNIKRLQQTWLSYLFFKRANLWQQSGQLPPDPQDSRSVDLSWQVGTGSVHHDWQQSEHVKTWSSELCQNKTLTVDHFKGVISCITLFDCTYIPLWSCVFHNSVVRV